MSIRIEQMIRGGHPDEDAYRPRPFMDVRETANSRAGSVGRRRRLGQLLAVAGIAAVLVGAVTLVTRPRTGDVGANPTDEIASLAGVDRSAVRLTEDGAVMSRWADGRLEVMVARPSGSTWTINTIASVDAPRPPNTSTGQMEVISCDGLGLTRSMFVFGQVLMPSADGTSMINGLSLRGADAVGGLSRDRTFAFAIRAGTAINQPFFIFDPRLPALPPQPWPSSIWVDPPSDPNAIFTGAVPTATACPAASKGTMPSPGPSGDVDPLSVPDYVAVASRTSDGIAGYARREDILTPLDRPTAVFGEDLWTVVGQLVPGKGFVPAGTDPATVPTMPAVDGASSAPGSGDRVALYIRNDSPQPVFPAAILDGQVTDSGTFDPRSMAVACYDLEPGARLVLLDRSATEPGSSVTQEVYEHRGDAMGSRVWVIIGQDGSIEEGEGDPAWFGSPVGC